MPDSIVGVSHKGGGKGRPAGKPQEQSPAADVPHSNEARHAAQLSGRTQPRAQSALPVAHITQAMPLPHWLAACMLPANTGDLRWGFRSRLGYTDRDCNMHTCERGGARTKEGCIQVCVCRKIAYSGGCGRKKLRDKRIGERDQRCHERSTHYCLACLLVKLRLHERGAITSQHLDAPLLLLLVLPVAAALPRRRLPRLSQQLTSAVAAAVPRHAAHPQAHAAHA